MDLFDQSMWRFACSGTLLLIYSLGELASRRAGAAADRPGVPMPAVTKVAGFVSLGVFYALIGPTGGALWNGWGNLIGIVAAVTAAGLRYVVRHGVEGVRHPTVALRMLFYTSLPLAVGVPWGWVALTLPAYALAYYRTSIEDRWTCERLGPASVDHMRTTRRWLPGIW